MTATLSHHCYHDHDVFAAECEQLFPGHWWLIGPLSELAGEGDYIALQLLKRPLVAVRDRQGILRGFYNLCRHRAGPLVTGDKGRCRDFVCRYHGWRYACSGELLRAPGFETDGLADKRQLGLLPVRIEAWNGLIFACLDDNAPGLEAWLGDIAGIAARFDPVESLQFDGESRKSAACNWKTYGDNSCEGYHVGMVHRALGSSMQRETVVIDTCERGSFVGFDVSYTRGEDQSRSGRGFWIYKFPGLLLHFAEYSFNAETVLPIAPDRIELKRWFWVDTEKARAGGVDPAAIKPASERVMDEDIAICERVQCNLASGVYPGGHLSKSQEPGTIFFQRLVRDALAGCFPGNAG